jgi:hypothetical protein
MDQPGGEKWQQDMQDDLLRIVNFSDRVLTASWLVIMCCFLLGLGAGWAAIVSLVGGVNVAWAGIGFTLFALVALLAVPMVAMDYLIVRLEVRRFNQRFPEGDAGRPIALELLTGLKSPCEMPQKMRSALGVPLGPAVSPEDRLEAGLKELSKPSPLQNTPPCTTADLPLHLGPPARAADSGHFAFVPVEPLEKPTDHQKPGPGNNGAPS